jgi:GNAT superfamily N-acetyltransferase
MDELTFELARKEHAKPIEQMRREVAADLTEKLGAGHWSGFTRLPSIRERIMCADPDNLRRMTLYVACHRGLPVGSVAVTTLPPGFWRRNYWREPKASHLGVFNLAVFPRQQRCGVGRFIMNSIERLAFDHGYAYIRLDAYTDDPTSQCFYQALGYDEARRIDVRLVALTLYEKCVGIAVPDPVLYVAESHVQ